MTPEEYEQAVAAKATPAFLLAAQLLAGMRAVEMTEQAWTAFLQAVYGTVQQLAWEAALAARDFYDAERLRQIPGVPRQDFNLPRLSFEQFVKDMESVRKHTTQPDFPVEVVAMRVARSVENSARRTIIRGVEDPDPILDQFLDEPTPVQDRPKKVKTPKVQKLVRGWARVPTGRETCGFCWMLCSRGPVYENSWQAGAKIGDSEVIKRTADGSMTSDDMNQWHTGCDCKTVPVFRLEEWPGKELHEAAWALWEKEIQYRYHGNDAINEYRKLVESGEIQKILAARKAA